MSKISLLVKAWYATHDRTILKQIFEEIQESNTNFFGACFKTWTNKHAIDDANECIQKFCEALYAKLLKEDDLKPIENFEQYCSTVRRRIFWNFKKEKEKRRTATPISSNTTNDTMEHLPEAEAPPLENHIWEVYQDFIRDAPRSDLSYAIFKLRIEEKLNHQCIADQLNKKFALQGNQVLNADRVRKRYSKMLSKWRKYYDKTLD
ncbi:sigma-70 RNA polymerase sigma factor region 4 domain-containing protein [Microscilla marina]|uniref:Uncharacterized protein n=1 Tax=Microscilla marina ATCC 23134 TaxID=313606 RepID=A1ZFL3_MICM2|nr:sigma-70 family RNA polymerase sigma factor [Microscilla marina]EAY30787.1 hypothetical protein M23134_01111 [Microscilla marina ATCC 23134]